MNQIKALIIPQKRMTDNVIDQISAIAVLNNIDIKENPPTPSVNNIYCRIIESCTNIDESSSYDIFTHLLLELSKFHTLNQFTQKHSHGQETLGESFILMSGAYLIRELGFLSMLHGSLTNPQDIDFSTKSNFQYCQLMTRQDREFQINSCNAGTSLLKSKVPDIEINGLGIIVRCCKNYADQIEFPSLTGHFIEKEDLLTFIMECSKTSELTSNEMNSFIFKHRKVNERL